MLSGPSLQRGHVSDFLFPAVWLVLMLNLCTSILAFVVAWLTSRGLVPQFHTGWTSPKQHTSALRKCSVDFASASSFKRSSQ